MKGMSSEWPAWFFGPDGQDGIFSKKSEVPEGWADHPSKVKNAEPRAVVENTMGQNGPGTEPVPGDRVSPPNASVSTPEAPAGSGTDLTGATPEGSVASPVLETPAAPLESNVNDPTEPVPGANLDL